MLPFDYRSRPSLAALVAAIFFGPPLTADSTKKKQFRADTARALALAGVSVGLMDEMSDGSGVYFEPDSSKKGYPAIWVSGKKSIANLKKVPRPAISFGMFIQNDIREPIRPDPKHGALSAARLSSFQNLSRLSISDLPLNTIDVKEISSIKKIERLYISGCFWKRSSAKSLPHLCECLDIKVLDLSVNSICDEHLKFLTSLRKLERLDLSSTCVTHKFVPYLRHSRKLAYLDVPGAANIFKIIWELRKMGLMHSIRWAKSHDRTRPRKNEEVAIVDLEGFRIQNELLTLLLDFRKLKSMNMSRTNISNTEVRTISKFAHITHLNLSHTLIDDECMTHIRKMNKLVNLSVINTRITDSSVDALSVLTKLKRLDVQGTLITPDGLRRLRKAIPKCKITG